MWEDNILSSFILKTLASTDELEIGCESGSEGIFRNGKVILEYFKAAVLGGRGPVADDLAVKGDDGLEYSVVAVGFAGMLGRKDDITALVADEIFIIRRDQMNRSRAESSGAAGFVNIELTAFPRFLNEFVTNDFDSFLTVADIQAGPPEEVLERGRRVASEIFPGKHSQGILSRDIQRISNLLTHKGIGVFHRVQVAAAKKSGKLRQTDVVGQAVIVHRDSPFGERGDKISLPGTTLPEQCFLEYS